MPFECDGRHALREHPVRAVFASFELVPHHRHLGRQVLGPDQAVHHAVGFEFQCEFQVLWTCRKRFVVVGAIDPGRPIEPGSVVLEFLGDVGVFLGAFEEHVFQQVSHSGFAVAFVPGPHEHGQVDGDCRSGLVGNQQDADPVVQPKLGNPLDGRHRLRLGLHFLRGHKQAQHGGGGHDPGHLSHPHPRLPSQLCQHCRLPA